MKLCNRCKQKLIDYLENERRGIVEKLPEQTEYQKLASMVELYRLTAIKEDIE